MNKIVKKTNKTNLIVYIVKQCNDMKCFFFFGGGGGGGASQEDILGLAISLIFDQFSIL